jgi:strictosidine synthase
MSRIVISATLAAMALGAVIALMIALSPVAPRAWQPPTAVTDICSTAAAKAVGATVYVDNLAGTPDGLAVGRDHTLYAGLSSGQLIAVRDGKPTVIAVKSGPFAGVVVARNGTVYAVEETGGNLYELAPDHQLEGLLGAHDTRRFGWLNDVAISSNGLIYFTNSSQTWTVDRFYEEALEHAGSGELVEFDPATRRIRVLLNDLDLANGVAVDPSGTFLLVAETTSYRVRRVWLTGPQSGQADIVIDGLPAFPGNIRAAGPGVFWLTFVSARSPLLDALAGRPTLRRLMAWLPAGVRPGPRPYPCVARITLAKDQAKDQAKDEAGDEGFRIEGFRVEGDQALPSFSTAVQDGPSLYLSPAAVGQGLIGKIYIARL